MKIVCVAFPFLFLSDGNEMSVRVRQLFCFFNVFQSFNLLFVWIPIGCSIPKFENSRLLLLFEQSSTGTIPQCISSVVHARFFGFLQIHHQYKSLSWIHTKIKKNKKKHRKKKMAFLKGISTLWWQDILSQHWDVLGWEWLPSECHVSRSKESIHALLTACVDQQSNLCTDCYQSIIIRSQIFFILKIYII